MIIGSTKNYDFIACCILHYLIYQNPIPFYVAISKILPVAPERMVTVDWMQCFSIDKLLHNLMQLVQVSPTRLLQFGVVFSKSLRRFHHSHAGTLQIFEASEQGFFILVRFYPFLCFDLF